MTRAVWGTLLLACAPVFTAGAAAPGVTYRMEITLEHRPAGGEWKVVDPATVFDKDAVVRFRFRANFGGYLYVMNQGTSGDYTQLFPSQDTGQENRIDPGREYLVPATAGHFKITGPAGHDVLYWVVTPSAEEGGQRASGYKPLPPPPAAGTKLKTLTPRCDDAVFRARGECVDNAAGPRKVEDATALPKNLQSMPGLKSRELIFIREKNAAVVSSPAGLKGPVIYEFRLAHK